MIGLLALIACVCVGCFMLGVAIGVELEHERHRAFERRTLEALRRIGCAPRPTPTVTRGPGPRARIHSTEV